MKFFYVLPLVIRTFDISAFICFSMDVTHILLSFTIFYFTVCPEPFILEQSNFGKINIFKISFKIDMLEKKVLVIHQIIRVKFQTYSQ